MQWLILVQLNSHSQNYTRTRLIKLSHHTNWPQISKPNPIGRCVALIKCWLHATPRGGGATWFMPPYCLFPRSLPFHSFANPIGRLKPFPGVVIRSYILHIKVWIKYVYANKLRGTAHYHSRSQILSKQFEVGWTQPRCDSIIFVVWLIRHWFIKCVEMCILFK